VTSPAPGASFLAPGTILLSANATANEGALTKVEFYQGTILIGTATTAPFTLLWSVGAPGTFVLTAKAYDDGGGITTSAPVTISVRSAITYLHNDFAGNPIAATDFNGALIWKENYRPYGARLNTQPASATNRQFFHGKPADADTGLSYFGARYYDPLIGRFMGVDPQSVDPGDIHSFGRYAYGKNNPYTYIDPDGRHAEVIIVPLILLAGWAIYNHVQQKKPKPADSSEPFGGNTGQTGDPCGFFGCPNEEQSAPSKKAQEHHICTNKNCVSESTGGPWTPRFKDMFDRAGMKLDDAANRVIVEGHKGPHPEQYHRYVYNYLQGRTEGLEGQAYARALQQGLRELGREIETPGSPLNRLVTGS
jgi:RHS repeat-associated protein